MSDNKKALYIYIYPYKFLDFIWDLWELNEFSEFLNIQVWDLSVLLSKKFEKSIVIERSKRKEVVVISSVNDFIRNVRTLRKLANTSEICIFNPFATSITMKDFLCNIIMILFLKNEKIKVYDAFLGGTPLFNVENKEPYSLRIVRFLQRVTLKELYYNIFAIVSRKLLKIIPSITKYRLVAGKEWESAAIDNTKIIVKGHSLDFSGYLRSECEILSNKESNRNESMLGDYGVFLSSPNPKFGTDDLIGAKPAPWTSEVWYPALCKFFDRIERETNTKIEITGHYRAKFEKNDPLFGYRNVHYGKTRELIKGAKYVITLGSTAISYAVIYKKPILFIYSNQLKSHLGAMKGTKNFADYFGMRPINIDDWGGNLSDYLIVNEERYKAYESDALTSTATRRPNVQIILEDIIGINTQGRFV